MAFLPKKLLEYITVSISDKEVADEFSEFLATLDESQAIADLVIASGGVVTVNGQTGVVTLNAANVGADSAGSAAAAYAAAIDRNNHTGNQLANTVVGSSFGIMGFDGPGRGRVIPGYTLDNTTKGFQADVTVNSDNLAQSFNVNNLVVRLEPLQNSPNDTWNASYRQIQLDNADSGFTLGVNGTAVRFSINQANHAGSSNVGSIEFLQNNFNIGNGVDAISVRGFGYAFGFGQINNLVNINGPMQGYGYQPNISASATIANNVYTQAFYDNANILAASPNYTSFNASPAIAAIQNNNNYTGLNVNANISAFNGNAGYTGIGLYGNLGTFGTGGYQGININPIITSAPSAVGLNINMDQANVYAGTPATLVIQDLTIATDLPGSGGNAVTIRYTTGATAGSEVVSQSGLAFTVQIQSGVSTANQIATALNNFIGFTSNLNVTITGVGGNPQVAQAATSLSGGTDPGNKKAASLIGDVDITGNLTFSGALSIGTLNAYKSGPLVNGSGNPASFHGLITQPTLAANTTVTNADLLGINTAMLLTMGDNSHATTSFVGVAALALPAVVSMGTGATIDRVSGATFAVSLDTSAAGGTIDILDLCRSIAIPNGVTAITKLRGYTMDLPFGDPGTTSWGVYISPTINNYFAGSLLIGGTPDTDDTVTNSSVAFEIKSTSKAKVEARMSTTQRDALIAINGMTIYNTTTNKFQGYANGTWVDLH